MRIRDKTRRRFVCLTKLVKFKVHNIVPAQSCKKGQGSCQNILSLLKHDSVVRPKAETLLYFELN